MKIIISILFIFFIGCGYKPSSVYQKEIVGDKIFTYIKVDVTSPKDSIFLKDALNEAVIKTFGGVIASKEESNTQMYVTVNSNTFTAIDYDSNGYPILYRVTSSITTNVIDKDEKKHYFTTTGTYDFLIVANSVISDEQKHTSIRKALSRALEELAIRISIVGMK